ncbi:MAG: hypothetical protein U0237_15995 [Thermoleophilia bacterium]
MERVPFSPSDAPSRNLGSAAVTLLAGVGTALLAAPFAQALALALLAHRVSASPLVVALAFVGVGMVSLGLYGAVTDNRIRGARGTALCALVPFVTAGLLAAVIAGL